MLIGTESLGLDSDYDDLTKESNAAKRAYVESLWKRFESLADPHFHDQVTRDFHRRYWEMHLACQLLDHGLRVESDAHGPDIRIERDGATPIWIEAVAPSRGAGDDAVPEIRWDGKAIRVPDDEVLLRLRSAIETKYRGRESYADEGVIGGDESYVVAVNGARVPWACKADLEVPRIVRSVLPIGHYAVDWRRIRSSGGDR